MPQVSLNQKKQIQCNYSDDFNGNVIDTFRVDLQKKSPANYDRGNIAVGALLYPHTTQVQSTSMGLIDSFLFSNNASSSYYANVQGGAIFTVQKSVVGSSHFAQVAATGAPTDTIGDMQVFQTNNNLDTLWVPYINANSQGDLTVLQGGTWKPLFWTSTLSQPALNSSFVALGTFRQPFLLLIGDANNLHTVDQVNNVMYQRLVLPNYHFIKWIRSTENRVYLGVSDSTGQYPGVYEYDPVNETAYFTAIDTLGANPGIPIVDQGVLIVFCADGRLREFNSGQFTVLAETAFSKRITAPNFINFHRNAGFVNNNSYYFLLPDSSNQVTGAWAGLYIYDKATQNFYHNRASTYGSSDAGQMVVGLSGALFSDGSLIFGSITDFAGGTQAGIYKDTDAFGVGTANRASFITPKVQSQNIQDVWKDFWLKYFLSGSDVIQPKVRSVRAPDIQPASGVSSGTWLTSTTFSVAGLSQSYVGMEVNIVYGAGAGFTSKIVSIISNIVTIADAVGANSGTLFYWVDDFQSLLQISATGQSSNSVGIIDSLNKGEWIQAKVELQGSSPIIEDVLFDMDTNLEI